MSQEVELEEKIKEVARLLEDAFDAAPLTAAAVARDVVLVSLSLPLTYGDEEL